MSQTWTKDPDDTLEYIFDFAPLANGRGDSDWLDRTTSPVETISTVALTTDSPGVTIDSNSITESNTSVTITVSGGTAGNTYEIECKITTSTGQIKTRTAFLCVNEQ